MQYLLPCGQCSEKHAIDPNQAGQSITCRCGAILEVPSLRGIRGLERVEATTLRRTRRPWSPLRGLVFGLGLMAVLVGLLIAGLGGWWRMGLDTSEPLPEDLATVNADIDRKSPEQALTLWEEEIRGRGLGPYRLPQYYAAREVA